MTTKISINIEPEATVSNLHLSFHADSYIGSWLASDGDWPSRNNFKSCSGVPTGRHKFTSNLWHPTDIGKCTNPYPANMRLPCQSKR